MKLAIIAALALVPLVGAQAREPNATGQAATIASGGNYTNCAACHGTTGAGGIGPALTGNKHLGSTAYAVAMVLSGTQTMPGFAAALTDAEIARVLTTVRSQWGNNYGPVTPAQVAEQRKALAAPAPDAKPGR